MAVLIAKSLFRKLQTLRNLTGAERSLAFATIGLTAAARLALWTLPFRWIKRFVETRPPRRLAGAPYSEQQVVRAVRLASRYVPHATCLTQALTGQILLNRNGIENKLLIGVAMGDGFEAHAWIECGGRVIIGGARESARYAPILTVDSNLSKRVQ
jgi:hypothetical protein